MGHFVERLALREKLHHAFRFGRSESRNFLLDCRWDRPVPDGKESQDSLLQAAFLPALLTAFLTAFLAAFLTALLTDVDQLFPGDSFFQTQAVLPKASSQSPSSYCP